MVRSVARLRLTALAHVGAVASRVLSAVVIMFVLTILPIAAPAADARVIRVPDGGVQPQAAADEQGVIHLVYLTGDPMESDVQYVRSDDAGKTFGKPVRVNTTPGSALAVGTIRGPHLSLGKGGRVHVAWMGSGKAPGKQAPMLYTRLGDDGRFEPERNVLTKYVGLDGGGSVAADAAGNVYVAWHAPGVTGGDEGTRRVFVARSTDDGATFAPEEPLTEARLGACGCCGMRLLAPSRSDDAVIGLFRTATDQAHRDTRAFRFAAMQKRPWSVTLDPMDGATCVMSTFALADLPGHDGFIAAWETDGRVRFGVYSYPTVVVARVASAGVPDLPRGVGGDVPGQKHPSVAVDEEGNVLIAWAEGTGWERGGSVAWQLFDRELRPIPGSVGGAEGLPAWGLPAAVPLRGGGFVVIY